jgi:hypothetical protein
LKLADGGNFQNVLIRFIRNRFMDIQYSCAAHRALDYDIDLRLIVIKNRVQTCHCLDDFYPLLEAAGLFGGG